MRDGARLGTALGQRERRLASAGRPGALASDAVGSLDREAYPVTVTEDVYLSRRLDDGGVIEFEERVTGFRAYWYTAPNTTTRHRMPSVTTILGRISGDGALLDWYEARGAEATLILSRRGFLDNVDPAHAIDAVREAGMGAKATAGQAAERGIRVHKVLETYLSTGVFPNPADYPEDDRGYLRGLARWLLFAQPEPVAIERLVCHPEFGYAGRLDLRARIRGKEWIVDLKTNRRTAIYRKACLQAYAYHVADVRCGADPAEGELLVAVGPDGTFAEAHPPERVGEAWAAGLQYHHASTTMGDIRGV